MKRVRAALAIVVVAVVALGAAGCGEDERLLPPGEFSGSTSLDQRLHLSLSGDEPKVNGQKAEWDGRGRIKLIGMPGEPVMSCVVQAKGEELRCEVPRSDVSGDGPGGGFETVELMRE